MVKTTSLKLINEINEIISKRVSITNIVDEETLFDYDTQFERINKNECYRKLTDLPYIRILQNILNEKLGIKMYLSISNTIQYNYYYLCDHNPGELNNLIFYTNSNVKIEIRNPTTTNGSTASIRIYTEDGLIDCRCRFSRQGCTSNYIDTFPNLENYRHLDIRTYISPYIYLDYYTYNSTEEELQELLFSNKKINVLYELIEEAFAEIERLKDRLKKQELDCESIAIDHTYEIQRLKDVLDRKQTTLEEQNTLINNNLNKIKELNNVINTYKTNRDKLSREMVQLNKQNKEQANEIIELTNTLELYETIETQSKTDIKQLKHYAKDLEFIIYGLTICYLIMYLLLGGGK